MQDPTHRSCAAVQQLPSTLCRIADGRPLSDRNALIGLERVKVHKRIDLEEMRYQ